MFTRRKEIAVPEVGADAPEFNLPSAQGGQLRLSMRTAHGPVVVVFLRGLSSEEDVAYFQALSEKEDEINHAGASVVGIGVLEPEESREFVRASGIKSYVLYDYVRITTKQWGLLEKDRERGEYARPAVFIVGSDHKIVHAWTAGRPPVEEILAKVSEITGLPKPPEKAEEKSEDGGERPKKMSAEERERIKAQRRAAREAGKSVKTGQQEQTAASEKASEEGEKPKKMSAEERARIKAERRAAREAGKSLKKPASEGSEVPGGESRPETGTERSESEGTPEGETEQPEARAGSEKPGEGSSEEE